MWDLIVSVPDHSLSFYFSLNVTSLGHVEILHHFKNCMFIWICVIFMSDTVYGKVCPRLYMKAN